jgi:hypothetical protein
MQIIAYKYEADLHCIRHTMERFPELERPPSMLWIPTYDNEGNEVVPVFDTDELAEGYRTAIGTTCPECLHENINSPY